MDDARKWQILHSYIPGIDQDDFVGTNGNLDSLKLDATVKENEGFFLKNAGLTPFQRHTLQIGQPQEFYASGKAKASLGSIEFDAKLDLREVPSESTAPKDLAGGP